MSAATTPKTTSRPMMSTSTSRICTVAVVAISGEESYCRKVNISTGSVVVFYPERNRRMTESMNVKGTPETTPLRISGESYCYICSAISNNPLKQEIRGKLVILPIHGSTMPDQRNVLKSVDTVFKITNHLKMEGGKTVTELSNDLDMPKSTVQVYLNTLYDHNFIVKNDRTYEIGLRFLEYGIFALQKVPIYPKVRPKVEELAESTGELAACFVEDDGDSVYIYGVEGERSIRTDLSVGDRSGLHCTSSGKAIMAHLPEDRIIEIIEENGLEQKTENTITDPDVLLEELERIRERGYAYSDQESVEGMRAVAAPILPNERILGSISLAGPANRFVGDRFNNEIPEILMGAANELELKLTYSQSGM